ncbi:hypothetical protein SAMN05216233_13320 [Desulfoluna spongiiphila]|uniref:Uncharacterized protein n=1 Tax=Desulfoluna spongiiphila TaxID=419481 RepID=A0A1G5JL92_9BACT|nr:hypothetical protein SAMN05216233_13320 [Desulfoluna spongiiphila]VVS93065.1 consensus disorder prediction [Desulfoluna spongiiphila]
MIFEGKKPYTMEKPAVKQKAPPPPPTPRHREPRKYDNDV